MLPFLGRDAHGVVLDLDHLGLQPGRQGSGDALLVEVEGVAVAAVDEERLPREGPVGVPEAQVEHLLQLVGGMLHQRAVEQQLLLFQWPLQQRDRGHSWFRLGARWGGSGLFGRKS